MSADAPAEKDAAHKIRMWLKAQANAERNKPARKAFIEAHNAALWLIENPTGQLATQWGDSKVYSPEYKADQGEQNAELRQRLDEAVLRAPPGTGCQCPFCLVTPHASCCAVHNAPAYPVGPCNCSTSAPIYLVFDSTPGPDGAQFIEAETADGKSVNAATWSLRPDGLAQLGPLYRAVGAQSPPSILTYQERLGGGVNWQLSPAERCMAAEIRDLRAALQSPPSSEAYSAAMQDAIIQGTGMVRTEQIGPGMLRVSHVPYAEFSQPPLSNLDSVTRNLRATEFDNAPPVVEAPSENFQFLREYLASNKPEIGLTDFKLKQWQKAIRIVNKLHDAALAAPVVEAPSDALTEEYIEAHIAPDEDDREAVTAIVREVESAHLMGFAQRALQSGSILFENRATWEPYLSDRADGVKGHYAICRKHKDGYRQAWSMTSHRWSSASEDVLTLDQANALMQAIAIPTKPTKPTKPTTALALSAARPADNEWLAAVRDASEILGIQFNAGNPYAAVNDLVNAVQPAQGTQAVPEGQAYGIVDPDYARVYTQARIVAWQYGYACVMHGSFTRDLDLLLVPWEEKAQDNHEQLLKLIAQGSGLRFRDGVEEIHKAKVDFTEKSHGRKSCSLYFPTAGDRRWIDISVLAAAPKPEQAMPEGFNADDLLAVADGLDTYEKTVNVGNNMGLGDELLESTTAYAARFIHAVIAAPKPPAVRDGE